MINIRSLQEIIQKQELKNRFGFGSSVCWGKEVRSGGGRKNLEGVLRVGDGARTQMFALKEKSVKLSGGVEGPQWKCYKSVLIR